MVFALIHFSVAQAHRKQLASKADHSRSPTASGPAAWHSARSASTRSRLSSSSASSPSSAARGGQELHGRRRRSPFRVPRPDGHTGGRRGLYDQALRGHQPVHYPRQARHHHAQGHPARPPYPWRARIKPFSNHFLGARRQTTAANAIRVAIQ